VTLPSSERMTATLEFAVTLGIWPTQKSKRHSAAGGTYTATSWELRISAIMIDQFGNVIKVIGIHDQWGSNGSLYSKRTFGFRLLNSSKRPFAVLRTTAPNDSNAACADAGRWRCHSR